MKIKKGDKVKVLNGKDRGKIGTVKEVIRKKDKVIVEGVNFVTKFEKQKKDQKLGGLMRVEGPMHISKVMLVKEEKKVEKNSEKKIDKKEISKTKDVKKEKTK
jgi:large subunit ribosomal protein L24